MLKTFKPLAALSLALIAGSASAVDIGFDNLTNKAVKTYKENGYVVTATIRQGPGRRKSRRDQQLQTSGFTFEAAAAKEETQFDLQVLRPGLRQCHGREVDLHGRRASPASKLDSACPQLDLHVKKGVVTFDGSGLDDVSSFTLPGTRGGKESEIDDQRESGVVGRVRSRARWR